MRRKAIWFGLAMLLLAGLAPAVWAESDEEAAAAPSPSLMFVWTDHVPVANAAAYEAESKKAMAKMAETEEGKILQFFSLSGNGGYSYVLQLADMADFSKKSQEFMAATMAAGGMQIWDAANQLVDHGSGQLIVLRSDLSYTPAEPRAEEATGQFRGYDWWYVRPGHEEAIEGVARRARRPLHGEEHRHRLAGLSGGHRGRPAAIRGDVHRHQRGRLPRERGPRGRPGGGSRPAADPGGPKPHPPG